MCTADGRLSGSKIRGSQEELRFAGGNEKSPHFCGDF